MILYTTIEGDTWDSIAKKVYGDESKTDFLMSNNIKLLDIIVFHSGVALQTPPVAFEKSVLLPPWRE